MSSMTYVTKEPMHPGTIGILQSSLHATTSREREWKPAAKLWRQPWQPIVFGCDAKLCMGGKLMRPEQQWTSYIMRTSAVANGITYCL